jgi:Flp pilus assembly protein TadG
MRILRRLRSDEQGQSLLEFVISFPIVLFLVLAIMQFALMWNAKQVVNYAAFCAARSYIVYGDEGKASLAAKIAAIPVSSKASGIFSGVSGVNLAGVVPSGVVGEIAYAADKFAYSYLATSIRLLGRKGRPLSDTGVSPERGDDITVEVTHKFRLIFPVINRLIGKPFIDSGTFISSWLQSFESSGLSPINIESRINNLFGNLYFFPITARCTLTMEETGALSESASCPYCITGRCLTADQVEWVPVEGGRYRLKREAAISLGYKTLQPFVSSDCGDLR